MSSSFCERVMERVRKPGRFGVGLLLIVLVVCIWVGSSALIQFVFDNTAFSRPFFLTYYSTSLFTVYLAGFACRPWRWHGSHRGARRKRAVPLRDGSPLAAAATDATVAPDAGDVGRDALCFGAADDVRRRRAADDDDADDADAEPAGAAGDVPLLRAGERSDGVCDSEPLSTQAVARFALGFAPLWFVANVTFNWSLALTSVSSSTIIASSSGLFTLLLGVALRLAVFRWIKLGGILLTMGGVVMVALFDKGAVRSETVIGDVVCLVSAIAYAVYANVLQRGIGDESRVSMAMFFGFVGLWNLVLMWPFFFVLHYTGLETFTWPSWEVVGFLTLNGLVGTVLSDWIWLQSMLLTTPLVSTLGLSLTIPGAILFDFAVHHKQFSVYYLGGSVLVLAGFVIATLSDSRDREQQRRLREAQEAEAAEAAKRKQRPTMDAPVFDTIVAIER